MKKNILPISTSLLILIADLITKYRKFGLQDFNISFKLKYIFYFVIIVGLIFSLLKTEMFTTLQRWTFWLMPLGLIGNIIMNKKVFNITSISFLQPFNIADVAVAISAIIMLLSIIIEDRSLK